MHPYKKLMNNSERITHQIISDAVATRAQVFSKVRVADVLEIYGSGISSDLYSYALKAHFDFVITEKDTTPLFAVEFDGPHHDSDAEA